MNPQPGHRSILSRLRFVVGVPLALAGVSLAGCSHAGPADEGDKPIVSIPVNSLEQVWSAPLDNKHGPITRLFARDEYVFAYTDDGTSYVMDRADGTILFANTVRHGGEALHPPVVLKDFIVYPTNTSLELYDKQGALVRSKDLQFSIRSDVVGEGNVVYCGTDYVGGGRLAAIDVTDFYLDHKWFLMFPRAALPSAPVVLGDIVYVATDTGTLTAVTIDTREPVWPIEGGIFKNYGPVLANLTGDAKTGIYVASMDTKLVNVNANTGKVRWQYLSNRELQQSPVVTNDLCFQEVPGMGLVAIDIRSGDFNRTPLWTASNLVKILSEDARYVYALRDDRTIVAVEKATGKTVFSSHRRDMAVFAEYSRYIAPPPPSTRITSTPPTRHNFDGQTYVVTTGNRVLALAPVYTPGVVGELAIAPHVDPRQAIASR